MQYSRKKVLPHGEHPIHLRAASGSPPSAWHGENRDRVADTAPYTEQKLSGGLTAVRSFPHLVTVGRGTGNRGYARPQSTPLRRARPGPHPETPNPPASQLSHCVTSQLVE